MKVTFLYADGHHEERHYPDEIEACESIYTGDVCLLDPSATLSGPNFFRRVWTRSSKGRVDFFMQDGTTDETIERFTAEHFA